MSKKAEDHQKRQMLTMRVTQQMRERIEAAAAKNGRSLSQEIELRLEHSFLADKEFGGDEQAELLRRISLVMDIASTGAGEAWWAKYVPWNLVRSSVEFLLRQYEPGKPPELGEMLSKKGLVAVREWEETARLDEEARQNLEREHDELELKASVLGLDAAETAHLAELKAKKGRSRRGPKLGAEDDRAWRADEERRQIHSRIWERLKPILALARERQPNVR